jgi:hypothetical protein
MIPGEGVEIFSIVKMSSKDLHLRGRHRDRYFVEILEKLPFAEKDNKEAKARREEEQG